MKEIKFKQRIKGMHGVKDYWNYWGFIDGQFIGPRGEVDWDERISYQYIGFKDNPPGKAERTEMYEGDIVRLYTFFSEEEPELNDSTIHRIEYRLDEDFPGFDLVPYGDWECNGISWALCDTECVGIEVIGNIEENPQLFEQTKIKL